MDKEDKKKSSELGNKLVNALNQLLNAGKWESSAFLKTAKNRIISLRDKAQLAVSELAGKSLEKNQKIKTRQLQPGYVEVYMLLYQADGSNLIMWRNTIKSLAHYSVTRPVYANEDYIRELIRSKQDVQRYGYIVVGVKESDILKIEKPSYDYLGHELTPLFEKAIHLENIISFIHANKKMYILQDDTLVFKADL